MSTIRFAAEPQNPDGPDSEVDLTVQTRPSRNTTPAKGSVKTSPPKRNIDTTSIQPDGDEDLDNQPKPSKKRRVPLRKRTVTSDEDTTGRDEADEERNPTSSKQTRVSLQSIDEDAPSCEDRRDIDNFFQSPVVKIIDGKMKKYCICKLCPDKKSLVNEITTLRSHLEAHHLKNYRKWARDANYESRLSGDIKKRKAAEEAVTRMLDDLREKKLTEPVVPYTDEAFHQAAIEWLVVTNQPLNALEHPKFKEMIDLVASAVNGV